VLFKKKTQLCSAAHYQQSTQAMSIYEEEIFFKDETIKLSGSGYIGVSC
jgi:hypothetical protein